MFGLPNKNQTITFETSLEVILISIESQALRQK